MVEAVCGRRDWKVLTVHIRKRTNSEEKPLLRTIPVNWESRQGVNGTIHCEEFPQELQLAGDNTELPVFLHHAVSLNPQSAEHQTEVGDRQGSDEQLGADLRLQTQTPKFHETFMNYSLKLFRWMISIYTVVQKTDTQFYFWDNFGNSAPILTILLLLQAEIYGA